MIVKAGNPIAPGAVTTVEVPDSFDLNERFLNTVGALSLHLRDEESPEWIETDDADLKALLDGHYAKDNYAHD
jgi:hypothetical protein